MTPYVVSGFSRTFVLPTCLLVGHVLLDVPPLANAQGKCDRACLEGIAEQYLDNTLVFLFETQLPVRPTKFAVESDLLERDYYTHWQGLKKQFSPTEVG